MVTERTSTDAPTVLLTGAGGSASANVCEALRHASAPYHVVGADCSPVNLHLSEAAERILIPRADDPAYVEALQSAVEHHHVDVLHVQPDPEVLAVGRHRDEIPCATFLPQQRALEIAADKALFAKAMAEAAVPVPESSPFESLEAAHAVVADLVQRHGRVWVRARRGAGSRASLPVSSPDQAVAWIGWWMTERGLSASDFMAAEILPKREFAYQSVWQHGELVVGQARERVEYFYGFMSPSGQSSTAAVARTVADGRIDDLAQRAVVALDPSPHGVYCVDIKEAADGTAKVTEINAGRFFTTSNFFAAAGLNMPQMAVRAALGEHLARLGSSPLEPDLYWIRMVDMGCRLVRLAELDTWTRYPLKR